MRGKADVEELKKELMLCLERQDPDALRVIRKLNRIAVAREDKNLLGYVYYRYAYYHYFTVLDLKKFRKYLQLAIRYLLRSDDKEFLGGAYNLVAYDAQDQGSYDVAYAYFMIAVRASEQVPGIALPGLLEANAGRLLIELGDFRQGRKRLRSAIRRMRTFPSMHVYNYNMILTYTDAALASFRLDDLRGVEDALKHIRKHYEQASGGEVKLSRSYYLLAHVYEALLTKKEKELNKRLGELLASWKDVSVGELSGLIYEIESLGNYMLGSGQTEQMKQLLLATRTLEEDENLKVAARYCTLKILYYEKKHDSAQLHRCLRTQYGIRKKQRVETMRTRRYSMEFSEMIENIAREREQAREENRLLQQQANTDQLTGLPNRNAINKHLANLFEKAQEEKTAFGIGIIDVDDFKLYNDTFGHQSGDECLRALGKSLQFFASDPRIFCARYGGDEFVVGYLGMSEEEIRRVAEEMERQVAADASQIHKRTSRRVQISQGIYCDVPKEQQKFWDYLSLADKELYRIKRGKEEKK